MVGKKTADRGCGKLARREREKRNRFARVASKPGRLCRFTKTFSTPSSRDRKVVVIQQQWQQKYWIASSAVAVSSIAFARSNATWRSSNIMVARSKK